MGYGMLRGWEEGWAVPSLGLAIHPRFRGLGAGRRLLTHLHERARFRGADTVRLKVYRTTGAAIALYTSLGYRFEPSSDTELLGPAVAVILGKRLITARERLLAGGAVKLVNELATTQLAAASANAARLWRTSYSLPEAGEYGVALLFPDS